MGPLSTQNIESELSYAYLHAVASSVGVCVTDANRHQDNAGIDATLTGWGPFPAGSFLKEVDLKVQLKATVAPLVLRNKHYSYELQGINRYHDLRSESLATPRILVVLFLPSDPSQWLELTPEFLLMRKCAYWVSLRGAGDTTNSASVTVYLPSHQTFHPQGLQSLLSRLSSRDIPRYQEGAV